MAGTSARRREWIQRFRERRQKMKGEDESQDCKDDFDLPKAEDDKTEFDFDFEDVMKTTAADQLEIKNETIKQEVDVETDIKVEPEIKVESEVTEYARETSFDQVDQSQEVDQSNEAPETFDVVAVDVGTGATRETFKIVKSRAMAVSRFFWNTLRTSDGNIDQSISLPDISAETFSYFHDFLRLGIVVTRDEEEEDVTSVFHGHKYSKEWSRLGNAWLLGSYLQSIPFRDAVVDAIIRKLCSSDQTPLDLFTILYRPEISKKACIKRLLIDIAVWTWKDEDITNEIVWKNMSQHPDFLRDFVEVLAKVRWHGLEGLPFFMRNTCLIYHEHVEEQTGCYRDWDRGFEEEQERALHEAQPDAEELTC